MHRPIFVLCAFLTIIQAKAIMRNGNFFDIINDSGDEEINPRQASQCGRINLPTAKVVNGEQSASHRWPWMVNILFFGVEQVCGGSLLDETHVVSAAHCFPQELGLDIYTLVLGDHSQGDVEIGQVTLFRKGKSAVSNNELLELGKSSKGS